MAGKGSGHGRIGGVWVYTLVPRGGCLVGGEGEAVVGQSASEVRGGWCATTAPQLSEKDGQDRVD
jgi:hypothetical protein